MKFLLSLVLIVGLVGCGDGASSPDGDAAQTNPQPQSDAKSDDQSNTETDAKSDTEIVGTPDTKKSDPATSSVAGTDILIGAWTQVKTDPNQLETTWTFQEGGEGRMGALGVPGLKFTWKADGTDKLEVTMGERQMSLGYAVTGDTLTLSPPNDGPQIELKRGGGVASSKHPAELVHTWKSDPIFSKGVTQTMVLGKSGDLVLTPKDGKATKGKWEVDGNRIKLMFRDPVSGDDRQQEFSLVIGGSEVESDDGKTTEKRASLFLKGVGDNKTSIMYERPLPAATETDKDEATAATPEESLAALKKLRARIQRNKQGEIVQVDLTNTSITDSGLKHLKGLAKLQRLMLDNDEISDDGLVHLKGLVSLQDLSLAGTPVSDEGLAHLKGLKKLTVLHLAGSLVTPEGIADFKEAVPGCKVNKPF